MPMQNEIVLASEQNNKLLIAIKQMQETLEFLDGKYPTLLIHRETLENNNGAITIAMCSHSEPEVIKALVGVEVGGAVVTEE